LTFFARDATESPVGVNETSIEVLAESFDRSVRASFGFGTIESRKVPACPAARGPPFHLLAGESQRSRAGDFTSSFAVPLSLLRAEGGIILQARRSQDHVPGVPDAPIGDFRLDLYEGKQGHMTNPRSQSKKKRR
jgi:hypothetical protein